MVIYLASSNIIEPAVSWSQKLSFGTSLNHWSKWAFLCNRETLLKHKLDGLRSFIETSNLLTFSLDSTRNRLGITGRDIR